MTIDHDSLPVPITTMVGDLATRQHQSLRDYGAGAITAMRSYAEQEHLGWLAALCDAELRMRRLPPYISAADSGPEKGTTQ